MILDARQSDTQAEVDDQGVSSRQPFFGDAATAG